MKGKTLLILLGIALLSLVYLYYGVEKDYAKKKKEEVEKAKVIPGEIEHLSSFRLKNNEGSFLLEREGTQWHFKEPFKDLVSKAKIDALKNNLRTFKRSKELPQTEELKQFGLDAPSLDLEIKTSDQPEPLTISLGKENPGKTGIYAFLPKTKELFIGSSELNYLRKQSPRDFREMRLLLVRSNDFQEVSLNARGRRVKFEKNTDGIWEMTKPLKLPVDQDELKRQFDKIGYIRAIEFSDSFKVRPTDPTAIRILVGFKEGVKDARSDEKDKRPQGAEIILTKKPKKAQSKNDDSFVYFAKGDKTMPARIARFHYDNFDRAAADYVKTTFDYFEFGDVATTEILSGRRSYKIAAKDGGFVALDKGVERPIDAKAYEDDVKNLLKLKATRYRSLVPLKETDSLVLKFTLKDGSRHQFRLNKNREMLAYRFHDKDVMFGLKPKAFQAKAFDYSRLVRSTEQKPKDAPKAPEAGQN